MKSSKCLGDFLISDIRDGPQISEERINQYISIVSISTARHMFFKIFFFFSNTYKKIEPIRILKKEITNFVIGYKNCKNQFSMKIQIPFP